MNIEGQEMKTYQIFVVPICNTKIIQEIQIHPREPFLKYQVRDNLDDKQSLKDSVALSDHIEKSKEDFVVPSAEIDKTIK